MIQLGIEYKKVCEYLKKYNVNSLEDIVGMEVFHIFPRQGVVGHTIENIEFNKNHREWYFTTNHIHKLVELGESIFFSIDEAREYEILQLHRRTLDQQTNIIKKRIEERNSELNKLAYLLERYPTEESRCKFIKCCGNCSHRYSGIIEGRVTCAEFGKQENCYFWQPDIAAFLEWEKSIK